MYQHAERTFEAVKANLAQYLRGLFPVEGKVQRLVLRDLEIRDNADVGDYQGQRAARMDGRSWSIPVMAQLELQTLDGKVVDKARVKLIDLPRLTNRGSYIVHGTEYMFPIQKRLRSGPYVRMGENDELRTFFNLAKGRNFHLGIHPQKGHFQFQIESSKNIPLYPLLRALGVSDDAMVGAWGRDVWKANVVTDASVSTKALQTIWEKMSYGGGEQVPPTAAELPAAVAALFDATQVDGRNAELTVGTADDKVTGRMVMAAATKMLKVARGDEEEDDRDSLIHNDIVDLGDFIVERFRDPQFRGRITRTIKFNVDRRNKISQIVSRDAFQRPVDSMMTESQLAQTPTQSNPLGMISDYTQITVRGEGGIQQENALTRSLRALDPSHLGFIDPSHTPEGAGVGTTLHLTVNTEKRGRDLVTRVLDVKTGKLVDKTPVEIFKSVVAFPEHVKDKKLVGDMVTASHRGKIGQVPARTVAYAFVKPEHLIDANSSTIPFISHNNGTRVMTASKMGLQAKPLADGDVPMVQVDSGEGETVEKAIGSEFSPRSPVSGVVEKVADDHIIVSGKKVQIPHYFPLNSNNFMHARPTVKVGDKVQAGQVLADTNYTKNGTLAIGKNLHVAYVPYKGMNVEDGVVVSEAAAGKLASEHLYQQSYLFDVDTVLDLKKFRSYFPAKITNDQAQSLDDQGVIKKGQEVRTGSILVAAMRRHVPTTESQRLAAVSRMLAKEFRDDSLVWEKDVVGVVQDVAKRANEIVVFVRTREPARIGDKIVGRYGNKGIIVQIIPNDQMPKSASGKPMDLLLNPNGVVSRMNLGQILETTASRVAEKTGKPFALRGFGANSAEVIAAELKKAGLKDHETIHDPVDNVDIPGVLVGHQHIYKLEHQATKKIGSRGGGAEWAYTSDQQPIRGPEGGRAVGSMELYALLAHGATSNVAEMYGFKSNFDYDTWKAIESGAPLPPPKPGHATQKFLAMLKGMGVDVEKRGGDMVMIPFLDRQVKAVSNGEVSNFQLLRGKDLREEKDGLFDVKKTGGVQGEQWTHIKLPEPIPNPTFEDAICSLLHISKDEFDDIVSGRKKVGALTGGPALKSMLDKIKVDDRIREVGKLIIGKTGSELNKLHKELRFLRALKDTGTKPGEYVISMLPVLPPKFRPVYTLPDGNLRVSDVNFHYQATMQIADQLAKLKGKAFGAERQKLAHELYKSVGGVMGFNEGVVERKPAPRGLAQQISGVGSPKGGFFHEKLLKKRQDVSATSVIVSDPTLGLDEVGIPEAVAWNSFRPFLVRELRVMGMTPLQAKDAIDKKTDMAKKALENVMRERHVILNRAPTLHKFSVMAFKPRLVPGYAIKIPPLIVGGFNADFDGDTMGMHVPVTPEANAEAAKMLPSQHLYKPGSGKLQPKIEHEYVLGMFKISRPGKVSSKRYGSLSEVISDLKSRRVEPDAVVTVAGVQGSTTPGRVLINDVIPVKHRDYGLIWTDKVIQSKLVEIDKGSGRDAFVKALQSFADIGRRYAYVMGSSFLLSDLQTMTAERNAAYRRADLAAARIRQGPGSEAEKERKIIDLYKGVGAQLQSNMSLGPNASGKSNNVADMVAAGARGNPDQVKQMVSSIGVMLDHMNREIPEPVRSTYTEGLKSSEFFSHMYGNRKGMIDKSQSVKDPGALTKQVIISAAGYRVSMIDCGTSQGVMEPVSGTSALDRYLAEPVAGVGSRNELVTKRVLETAKARGATSIKVRSPLTCTAAAGVCSRCYGLDEEGKPASVGEHVGIKDTHGLTEPTTQLAMKTFHTGGVATGKTGLATGFDRIKKLFTMPDTVRDKATLAEIGGRVEAIGPNPFGGTLVTVAGVKHRVPVARKVAVRVGDQVVKGQRLSDGDIQPQDMLRLNGLRAMQTQLRDDIGAVYAAGGERIHAKTIEVPVRMLTESVRISDAGDHPSLVPGDYSTYGRVDAWNRGNPGKKPVRYVHILPGSEFLPHRTDDWAQRLAHNRIGQVLQEAPAMGARAPLQGGSPFAALVFGKKIEQDPWRSGGLTSG
jgi:DNA-directed RNA polymerase subunit beta'